MPASATPYGYPAPVINPATGELTVAQFLARPPYIQRAIRDLTRLRFLTEGVLFARGPAATGGAVVFDQVVGNDLFLERDVQDIEPGAEFPLLTPIDAVPQVALARKFGGEVFLTWEAIRRDNRALLGQRLQSLRNTIVRRTDEKGMAALRAAAIAGTIPTMVASGDWSLAATDLVRDVATAMSAVDALDMGYEATLALVNPAQALDVVGRKDIRTELDGGRSGAPIILTGWMGRLLNMNWVTSNRVLPGEVWIGEGGRVGSISDEVPTYALPIDDPRRERTYLHGARVPAFALTDPKSFIRITGA